MAFCTKIKNLSPANIHEPFKMASTVYEREVSRAYSFRYRPSNQFLNIKLYILYREKNPDFEPSIASDILSTILLPNPYQKHILQPYVQILK